MTQIMINNNKRIGKVIFIVEGEETEPTLISHIFGTLFHFNVIISNPLSAHSRNFLQREKAYSLSNP